MKIVSFTYLISKESGRSRPHYVCKSNDWFKATYLLQDASLLTNLEVLEVMNEIAALPQIHIQITSP